jgi:hypothetical protein
VADDEKLARTVHSQRLVRAADQTVKPEVFLPYRRVELSVIRHRELTDASLWEVCRVVAAMRNQPLLGRADILALDARKESLDVYPNEGGGQPLNHADIVGWPPEKPSQMMKAVQLAAKSIFVPAAAESPPGGDPA